LKKENPNLKKEAINITMGLKTEKLSPGKKRRLTTLCGNNEAENGEPQLQNKEAKRVNT